MLADAPCMEMYDLTHNTVSLSLTIPQCNTCAKAILIYRLLRLKKSFRQIFKFFQRLSKVETQYADIQYANFRLWVAWDAKFKILFVSDCRPRAPRIYGEVAQVLPGEYTILEIFVIGVGGLLRLERARLSWDSVGRPLTGQRPMGIRGIQRLSEFPHEVLSDALLQWEEPVERCMYGSGSDRSPVWVVWRWDRPFNVKIGGATSIVFRRKGEAVDGQTSFGEGYSSK